MWSQAVAGAVQPVITYPDPFRREHHNPFAVLSNSISEEQARNATNHFTNTKEMKLLVIGVNLCPLFMVRFQPNLTMAFCLTLIFLPVVFH